MISQGRIEQFPLASDEKAQAEVTPLFLPRLLDDSEHAADQATPEAQESEDIVKKKASGKKKSGKKKKKTLGSAKGVETMFRTAYRAQLDLMALAATKANIMISLNGLILSVLTLSGPFVLLAEPMFTAPIAVFLATCLISIIFAVLSAQPWIVKKKNTLEDFNNDKANILVFEQFASLSITEHTKVMTDLIRNNKRIYKNMSRQLYQFGIEADRKTRLLKYSYSSFLVGLTISTLMLLAVALLFHTHDLSEVLTSLQSRILPFQQGQ